jgi:hypothetical protein
MSSPSKSMIDGSSLKKKNSIRDELNQKMRLLMSTIKVNLNSKNKEAREAGVSSMGKMTSDFDSKISGVKKLIMSNNPRNPQKNGFTFAEDQIQGDQREHETQNLAKLEGIIQDQPVQQSRATPVGIPPTQRMENNPEQENINDKVKQMENQRQHPSEYANQLSEMQRNRQSQAPYQNHPPGRNLNNNINPNVASNQQMEMGHRSMARQNHQYYQAQQYHHMQENPQMPPIRNEMQMQGGAYRQQPSGQEMYGQMMGGRQYIHPQGYTKQQMMGSYYDGHGQQMQPQFSQENYEKIKNLERVYFEVLKQPVKISHSHGQYFVNYRGAQVPLAKMNEYVGSIQKSNMEQQGYRQNEYYSQAQPSSHPNEYHMNNMSGRMNPGYENSQMNMGYRYANGGHYDHAVQYQQGNLLYPMLTFRSSIWNAASS